MKRIVITIMLLAFTQYVAADTLNGSYIGFSGSANKIRYMDLGYETSGKLGYKFENSFRSEAEVSYRMNSHSQKGPYGQELFHEKLRSLAFMGNVVYDFYKTDCKLYPHLGIGIGYVVQQFQLSFNENYIEFDIDATSSAFNFENITIKDGGFAYQIFFGLNYPISEMCEVSIELKYFNGHHDIDNNSLGCAVKRYF